MLKVVTDQELAAILSDVQHVELNGRIDQKLCASGLLTENGLRQFQAVLEQTYQLEFGEEALRQDASINELVQRINNLRGLNQYTVRRFLMEVFEEDPEADAIAFDKQRITYAELTKQVRGMAANLMQYGVKKDSKVAIMLDNTLSHILVYFTLFYIGALPVPISNRWGKGEVFNVMDDSDCAYVICQEKIGHQEFGRFVREYVQSRRKLTRVFCMEEAHVSAYDGIAVPFSDIAAVTGEEQPALETIAPEDVGMISYTSGTTGTPKGVLSINRDIVQISCYAAEIWKEKDGSDFPLSIAPLYSAQGFMSLFANVASKKCFKMLSTFNPNDILAEVSKLENTSIHTQPTMWALLLNCKIIGFSRFDALKKVVVSGSVCSPELSRRIEQTVGCKLLNCYGLIEGTSVATMTRVDDSEEIRFNTVGRPIPGVEMKIVDKDRNEVTKGEIGELAIRGYVMAGYYRNEARTKQIIDADGWLYTGDLARYYDEENISIVGRCKDMIIRGGFNVYPSDIEEYILQMPEVQNVSIVGKEHPILGEEIVAFVIPKAGVQMDKGMIRRFLFHRIANYKMPDQIHFVTDLPMILAGKIDKKELKDWAEQGIPKEKQTLFQ